MGPTLIRYENLPEPPHLGISVGGPVGGARCTIQVDGREVEVISVRLDNSALPGQMPTWLFLRAGPGLTMLLHTCGDGSGWREVDEGALDLTIGGGRSSKDFMTFVCLRCTSMHRMRGDGFIDWQGMVGDD